MATGTFVYTCGNLDDVNDVLSALRQGTLVMANLAALDSTDKIIADDEIRGAAYVLGMEWRYMDESDIIIVSAKGSTSGNTGSMTSKMFD